MKKIFFGLASLAIGGAAFAQSGALLVDSNGTVRTTNRVTFPGELNVTGSLLTNGSPLAAGGGGASNVSDWARSAAVTNIDAGGWMLTNVNVVAGAGGTDIELRATNIVLNPLGGSIYLGEVANNTYFVFPSAGVLRLEGAGTVELVPDVLRIGGPLGVRVEIDSSGAVTFGSVWTNSIRDAVAASRVLTVSNGLVLNGVTNGTSTATTNTIALPVESAQRAFVRSTNTYALVFGSTNTWHTVSNSYAVAQFPGTVSASSAGVVVSNAGTYMVRYDAALAFPTSAQYRYGLFTNGAIAATSTRNYRATGATTWEGPAGIADVLDLPAGALITPAAWAAAGAGSTLQISNVVITVQRIPATP